MGGWLVWQRLVVGTDWLTDWQREEKVVDVEEATGRETAGRGAAEDVHTGRVLRVE